MIAMKIKSNDYFGKIELISHEYLLLKNISGIILDIDNTIVADGKTEIPLSIFEWLKDIELPVCLLSNGRASRVKFFAESLELNYVYRAKKPFKAGYCKAAKLLDIEDFAKIAVIGDQLFSDILGGNIHGFYTIKIEPIDKEADPLAVKVKRWFERFVA